MVRSSHRLQGHWAKEEDKLLLELVAKHGQKCWSVIAASLRGRVGKQCRERWHNHLKPDIRRDEWDAEEVRARQPNAS